MKQSSNTQTNKLGIINLVPRFVNFYNLAKDKPEEERWALWKEHYNFAAVPPGEQGQQRARELLNTAWEKYTDILPYIETWEPDCEQLDRCFQRVKEVLECNEAIDVNVAFFVGCFENNAFVAPAANGRVCICLPIEDGVNEIVLAHELTHIVHSKMADISVAWERAIGTTVLMEGLAIHVSKELYPGEPDAVYTAESTEGWLERCSEKSKEMLNGVLPYFQDNSMESILRFTSGKGTTGEEREVYYLGWELVPKLLEKGLSYTDLARMKEKDIPCVLRETIQELCK